MRITRRDQQFLDELNLEIVDSRAVQMGEWYITFSGIMRSPGGLSGVRHIVRSKLPSLARFCKAIDALDAASTDQERHEATRKLVKLRNRCIPSSEALPLTAHNLKVEYLKMAEGDPTSQFRAMLDRI